MTAPAAQRAAKSRAPAAVLGLQRMAGNRAVSALITGGHLPPSGRPPVASSSPLVNVAVQRQNKPDSSAPPADAPSGSKSGGALRAIGISMAEADLKKLDEQFPEGDFVLNPVKVVIHGQYGSNAAAARLEMRQIVGKNYTPRSATYLVETGAGRAIILVGADGATRLFDAGNVVGYTARAVNALRAAGLAKTPEIVKISHTDSDHLTDLEAVVNGCGMPKPSVEITKQQLNDPAIKAFASIRLTAVRNQVVEIDVTGDGLHVHREVSGALQGTDLRWAPAHAGLSGGGSKRATNAGSPVSIVRDLLTGEVRVYTADSEPSTVMKMFDYIHPSAMPYIFGEGQLKEFELPHHGGANTETRKTEAGLNYLRFLRLAYDASDGTSTFFAQTETEKLEQQTNHVRCLHAAGFPIETVVLPKAGSSGMKQVSGGVASPLALTPEEQAEVAAKIKPAESALMQSRKAGHSVQQMRTALEIQIASAEATGSSAIATSARATLAQLEKEDAARVEATNSWWTAVADAVKASGGFNKNFDPSGARAAADKLGGTEMMKAERLNEFESSVNFNSAMMESAGRVYELALGMTDAMLKQDPVTMTNLKTQQGNAYREAVQLMGSAKVLETVREAWRTEMANLQKMQGELMKMSDEAARAKRDNRMAMASMSALAKQMQAEAMVNAASEGRAGIPKGPGGDIRQGARVGAGAMAALEVIRIVLETWANIRKGMAAAELRAVKRQLRGMQKLQWWLDVGASPGVQLLDDDDNPLNPAITDLGVINKIMAGENIDKVEVSAHPRIVIASLTSEDQQMAVSKLMFNAVNLNDFHQLLFDARAQQDEQKRPPVDATDDGKQWGAYVWDFKKKDYVQQVDAKASQMFAKVYQTCFDNSDAELKRDQKTSGRAAGTVAVSGIWFKTRDFYTFSGGGRRKKEFPFEPALSFPTKRPSGGDVQAKAADATTYAYLRQFDWPVLGGGAKDIRPEGSGNGGVEFRPNVDGYCFVDASDVALRPEQPAETSAAAPK
ncbi:hypothetical protein [Mycobacterium sp. AZCC_0083]|uniref:hypothetical protein n=1 Tax=Mycobacterium sp. AZCC_0083 TaxID=2735882 RepID=UPI00161AA230|nr:hypothetical protein [Mycobacterium sp. AZCC_0083]